MQNIGTDRLLLTKAAVQTGIVRELKFPAFLLVRLMVLLVAYTVTIA